MLGSKGTKFDWPTIYIYITLVVIGWVNIYSASYSTTSTAFFDFSQVYVKQLVWISLSLVLIPFILTVEAKFYERFSSIIYIISLISLVGLFFLGKKLNFAAPQTGTLTSDQAIVNKISDGSVKKNTDNTYTVLKSFNYNGVGYRVNDTIVKILPKGSVVTTTPPAGAK